MSTLALRGFQSLRTVHNHPAPVDPALIPPKRSCALCGAILRRSNPGDICCPCAGHVDIPEWVAEFAELDGRPSTVAMLAALLTGEPGRRSPVLCREEIVQLREGGMSHGAIARLIGRKKATVQGVLWREARRGEK